MKKDYPEFRKSKQGKPDSGFNQASDDRVPYVREGTVFPGMSFGELQLVPKASSSGGEGTIFYDSDDNHLYVATE